MTSVILGSIWYLVAWSDQQPFKLLSMAGIIIFLINLFEMTKPLNAFERVTVGFGIGFALHVAITLGWLVLGEWLRSVPEPIYA